ncbi:MAG: triose-phosphate isomerase, partial [Oscillospiraceae bacterium]|nr:triose-phosphate isomerase [Oscillospiraceae bacterium]
MNKQLRKAVIAGNWKMNLLPAQAAELITELKPLVAGAGAEVVVCTPYIDLPTAIAAAKGSNIKVGAQNCHWAQKGAFTGEVAAVMLEDLGADYVIIGHSERRALFGDTNETVQTRTRAALDAGLEVILCVGEVLEERQKNITLEVVRTQAKIALAGVRANELAEHIVIAYEPVWAIGTGLTATAAQANEVNKAIRGLLAELYDQATAEATVIQYGGSMNA